MPRFRSERACPPSLILSTKYMRTSGPRGQRGRSSPTHLSSAVKAGIAISSFTYQGSRSPLRKFLLLLLLPFLIGREKAAYGQPLRDERLAMVWQQLPNTSQSCSYTIWKKEVLQMKYSIKLTKITFMEEL